MMTDKDYARTQRTMLRCASILNRLDLLGYIERNSLADTTGPILEPTLYRKAADRLDCLRRIAMGGQQTKTAFKQLRDVVLEEGLAEYQRNHPELSS